MPLLLVFDDFLPFEFFAVHQEFVFALDLFSFALPNHFYDFLQFFVAMTNDLFGHLLNLGCDFGKPLMFGADHRYGKPWSRRCAIDWPLLDPCLTPFDSYLTRPESYLTLNDPFVVQLVAT